MNEYAMLASVSAGGGLIGLMFIRCLYVVHGFYQSVEEKTRKHGKFISATIDIILRTAIMFIGGYCIFILPIEFLGQTAIFGYKLFYIYFFSGVTGYLLNLLYRTLWKRMANRESLGSNL